MAPPNFRHDNEPAGDLANNPQPILGYPRPVSVFGQPRSSRAASAATQSSTAKRARPQVVLALPEITARAKWSRSHAVDLANIMTWIVIAVGAIVAVGLIWTAPKRDAHKADEAPAWEQHETWHPAARSHDSAGDQQQSAPLAEPVAGEPRMEPPAEFAAPPDPENQGAPEGDSQTIEPNESPGDVMPHDAAARRAPLETARSRPTQWDGGSGPRPGEAAPAGKIMNVVPQ